VIDQNISTGAVQVNASNVTVANYNYAGSGTPPRDWGTISPTPTGWIGASHQLPGADHRAAEVTIHGKPRPPAPR